MSPVFLYSKHRVVKGAGDRPSADTIASVESIKNKTKRVILRKQQMEKNRSLV
jgi:hypothetical protein